MNIPRVLKNLHNNFSAVATKTLTKLNVTKVMIRKILTAKTCYTVSVGKHA